ncbi:uncharacterized protein LOC132624172 [Lycium barbarum]|uniref:uncharacterized protein LOC132624172 n=1 Tax=Lycium barbarum TaxID=112863 RepID=UPI00293E00C6|nr:uncharacterized protein LOC132624172 [Lycium barbarum]
MDISRIQAYAKNLKDRKRQRRTERERDRGHGSTSPRFSDLRFDRSSYSRAGQSSKALGSQHRLESGQMRPPLLRCAKCSKLHAGQCRLGSDVCYVCGKPSHRTRQCSMRESGGMVQPTGSVAGSSSVAHLSGQGSQVPAGRGRQRSGASSLSGHEHRVYALAGR